MKPVDMFQIVIRSKTQGSPGESEMAHKSVTLNTSTKLSEIIQIAEKPGSFLSAHEPAGFGFNVSCPVQTDQCAYSIDLKVCNIIITE